MRMLNSLIRHQLNLCVRENYESVSALSILIVAMVKPSKGGEGELVAEESCIAPDSNSLAGGGGGSVVSDGIDGEFIISFKT